MPSQAVKTYMADPSRVPFCKGCGHTHVMRRLDGALVHLGLDPADICLVTDIGCIGMADALFPVPHTVHTTHGRSTAFATGISVADAVLGAGKLKTVVLIGDGGAMIGLLHLVNGALLNADVTVLLCNNFLFGMTGGQNSAFSPIGFNTPTTPTGNYVPPLDICSLVSSAHAGFVARTLATDKDLDETMRAAIEYPGFSLVEIVELCPEHGIARNPGTGKNLGSILDGQGYRLGVLHDNRPREDFGRSYRTQFNGQRKRTGEEDIPVSFSSDLGSQERIVIAGSAGERVQSSAHRFCKAAVMSGLFCTQKNDNPVTQGSGFSLSEVIISPERIDYTGAEEPTAILVVSDDGLNELKSRRIFGRIGRSTLVLADRSLELPSSAATVQTFDFRQNGGPKEAARGALAQYIELKKPFPATAFREAWS